MNEKGQFVSIDVFNELHSQWMDLQEKLLDYQEKARGLEEALEKISTNDEKTMAAWLLYGQWCSQVAKEALAKFRETI